MRRYPFIAAWVVLASVVGCNCQSENPCTNCPAIAGTYAVALNDAQGNVSPDCASLGIGDPQGPLVLSQTGAALTALYSDFNLTGTLFDSYNFDLNGAGADGGSSMSVHGTYLPVLTDGGGSLQGNLNTLYTGNLQGGGQGTCTQVLPFTATLE